MALGNGNLDGSGMDSAEAEHGGIGHGGEGI